MKCPTLTPYLMVKDDSFDAKIRNKIKIFTVMTFIQHYTEGLIQGN
jgi:hypothetical protein